MGAVFLVVGKIGPRCAPPADRSRQIVRSSNAIALRAMADRDGGSRYASATRQRAARIVRAPVHPCLMFHVKHPMAINGLYAHPCQRLPLCVTRCILYTNERKEPQQMAVQEKFAGQTLIMRSILDQDDGSTKKVQTYISFILSAATSDKLLALAEAIDSINKTAMESAFVEKKYEIF